MSDSQSQQPWASPYWGRNMLSHAPMQHIPLPGPLQQVMGPQGPLPAQSLFAGLSPEQQFWLQHLMGQNVGQPGARGPVDPYYMMMMQQGQQPGGIYAGEQQPGMLGMGEPGF